MLKRKENYPYTSYPMGTGDKSAGA